MAVRSTKGVFAGQHAGNGVPTEEVNAELEIVTDDREGTVKAKVRGEKLPEVRNQRVAIHMAYLQERLRSADANAAFERRRPGPIPKPERKAPKPDRYGMIPCPKCSVGLIDPWDCDRCDGAGRVRPDDSTMPFDREDKHED
jgi:hypothetical protein